MAYDTVIDKAVFDQSLTQMANLIRAESNTQEGMHFPRNMPYRLEKAFRVKNNAIQAAKDETKAIIERTATDLYNEDVVRVSPYSLYHYTSLKTAEFPNAASAGESAFESCWALTSVKLPNAEIIGKNTFKACAKIVSISLPKAYEVRYGAFDSCTKLENIDLPALQTIGQYTFASCTALKSLDLHNVTSIPNHAFRKSPNLSTLYLRSDSVVTLADVGAFYSIEFVTVYVPGNLIASYKTAANWSALYNDGVVSFLAIPGTEVETSLISFSINGVAYQAEEGMTWVEWCDSEYNPGIWSVSQGYVKDAYANVVSLVGGGDYLPATETIIAGYAYGTSA